MDRLNPPAGEGKFLSSFSFNLRLSERSRLGSHDCVINQKNKISNEEGGSLTGSKNLIDTDLTVNVSHPSLSQCLYCQCFVRFRYSGCWEGGLRAGADLVGGKYT